MRVTIAIRPRSPAPRGVRGCALVISLAACRDRPGETPAEPGVSVHEAARPAARRDVLDFVDRQLALRGAQFNGSFVEVGVPMRGTLAQGGTASHGFDIVGGHCYRVLAVGDVDVNDLDLALYGPDGSQVDADNGADAYPLLGGVRPLCPPTGGSYRIEVRMRDGQGAYGIEIFRTP